MIDGFTRKAMLTITNQRFNHNEINVRIHNFIDKLNS